LEQILIEIIIILKEQPIGLRIDSLYFLLNKKLGAEFDYKLFNCMDFYGFLANYAEVILDIECKQNTFFIYEKNIKFGSKLPERSKQMKRSSKHSSQDLTDLQTIQMLARAQLLQEQIRNPQYLSEKEQNFKNPHLRLSNYQEEHTGSPYFG